MLDATTGHASRVLHFSAEASIASIEERCSIALALASHDADRLRISEELALQREIWTVRLLAARVMRAVGSEIVGGDVPASYVVPCWAAATHQGSAATILPACPPAGATNCCQCGSPCERWQRGRTSRRCASTLTRPSNVVC